MTLDVPEGALDHDVTLTVTKSSASAPAGYTSYSSVYVFGPDGTQFAKPITVTLPYEGPSTGVTVYWSSASGSGFDAVPTTLSSGAARTQVTHFSSGFVAATAMPDGGTVDGGSPDAGTDNGVWDSTSWDQSNWQ